ncbi:MAG: response regulator [Acidobacteriota bacterium]
MALLIALFLGFSTSSWGQSQDLRFQHLRLDDGLSQVSVFAIHQDARGFLWLGTRDGLNRWDGTEFIVYRQDPENVQSLPNSYVRTLTTDGQDTLWIGTFEGLAALDPTREKFEVFHHDPEDPNTISGESVRDLHADADSLWIATLDGGIDRLDIASREVERLEFPSQGDGPIGAGAITGDSTGRLWIGLLDGLATLPPGGDKPVRFQPDVVKAEVQALHIEPGGALWAGTPSGLLRVEIDRGRVQAFQAKPGDPTQLQNDVIRSLTGSRDGSLWIGTEGGLHRLDPDRDQFEQFVHDANDSWSLAEDRVTALFEDMGGLLWVGTILEGADRVDLTQPFEYVGPRPNVDGGLQGTQVSSFLEISEDRILLGSISGQLQVWDRRAGRFDPFDPEARSGLPAALPAGAPMTLMRDRGGDLWVGTMRAGLARRPEGQDRFRVYSHDPEDPNSLSANAVVTLLEDSRSALWVSLFQRGINRYDREKDQFVRLPFGNSEPDSLAGTVVAEILEGVDGEIWLAVFDGGLSRLDPETERFEHFSQRPGDLTSFPSKGAIALHQDDAQRLWIGTLNGGLARLESAQGGGTFRTWNESDGLPSNAITGIESSSDGQLWIATNVGLVSMDPETESIRVFKTRHGLPSGEFLAGAHLQLQSGELIFGGGSGFTVFDPTLITPPNPDVPLVLSALRVGNRTATLPLPAEEAGATVVLEPSDRQVTFEFAALDFAAPDDVKYRYRLRGFDEDWVELDSRRPVTYTNLDPGEYRFEADACTADAACVQRAIGVPLTVKAPLWQTGWAIFGYLLAATGLIYSGTRWRLQGLQRRSRELQALVGQRTTELSQTIEQLRQSESEATSAQRRALKSLEEALEERRRAQEANSAKSAFLSNMSHELRTPLNAMLGFAQLMERDPALSADHHESLGTILRSGEHLLCLINDVLSLSKIEAGKLTLSQETFEPRRLLASALEMVRGRAEEKGLELHEDVDSALPQTVRGDSGRLLQILVNLLSNAVKFTETGRIDVRLLYRDGRARFEVEDTGPGIAPADVERLFEPFVQSADGTPREGTGLGLTISRRLAEIMGGEMEVWSELGKGSTFAFDVPLAEATTTSMAPRRRRQVAGLALDQAPPRVLIVDDAEENRRLLSRLLSTVNISVREAADGVEAVETWGHWRPELIFMDIRMPRMTGDEAARRIRQAEAELGAKRTIIIALTATAFEHDRRRILAAGCDDLVTKPFQDSLLFDKLTEHLEIQFLYKDRAAPPSAPAKPAETRRGSKPAPVAKPSRPWRVLLAEDNTANQLVARRMLERLGIEVEVVGNGRAAVDAFSRDDFDLVLMDVRMPEMDGLQATRRLRNRLPRDLQPVIVALTGLASEDERRKCLDAGMDAVMPKPFRLDDLESLVEKWLPPPTRDRPQPRSSADESVTDLISRADVEKVRRTAANVAAGILDYRKLEALRQLDHGTDTALATQVIDLFLDTVPSQVDELRRAVTDGDRHRWRRLAHSLKNSSSTLGAEALAESCKELEDLGRLAQPDSMPEEVDRSLERLVAAATEALAALENERGL